jgi:hypothetical protein
MLGAVERMIDAIRVVKRRLGTGRRYRRKSVNVGATRTRRALSLNTYIEHTPHYHSLAMWTFLPHMNRPLKRERRQ